MKIFGINIKKEYFLRYFDNHWDRWFEEKPVKYKEDIRRLSFAYDQKKIKIITKITIEY